MSTGTGFSFNPKKEKWAQPGTFFTTPSPKVSQNVCTHTASVLYSIHDGTYVRQCNTCGYAEVEEKGTGKNAPPSHYLKRKKIAGVFAKQLEWTRQEWGAIRPQSRIAAEKIIDGWNKDAATMGMAVEYKVAPFDLRCGKCNVRCGETYKGDLCYSCHINTKVLSMPPKKPKVIPLVNPKWAPVTPLAVVRKEGDIWKLPAVNSPMWTSQWAYQGSAKEPYIISRRTDGSNGSTTSEGWACSCMNFTRNTPRTECKHILKVMMSEGLSVNKTKGAMSGASDAELKAFKAWQKEQAAAGNPVGGDKPAKKMNLFDQTSRKFR